MTNKFLNFLWASLLLVIWGVAWLAQHIACFDPFDSNLLYLYLLASVFAVLQWIALFLARKCARIQSVFYVCMSLYALGAFVFFFWFITFLLSPGSSWGLMILSVLLDIGGALLSYRHATARE